MITKDIQAPIFEVAQAMNDFNVGIIPITKDNKIVGVVTDRDICVLACSNQVDLEKPIADYITRKVITVDCDDTIHAVLEVMRKNQIKRVLVLKDKKIIGIISLSDIIHHHSYMNDLLETMQGIFTIDRNVEEPNTSVQTFEL